jgi:ketosteroid isomerase-like protein
MTVIAEVLLRGVSREQYDAIRAECRWLEEPPEGGIAHLAWWDGDDSRNVNAWTSEDAYATFGEQRLAPAMARVGVDVEPEVRFHPAHEVFRVTAGVDGTVAERAAAHSTNADVLRRGYAAFAEGDVPAVLALLDQGITWYTPDSVPYGGHFTSPQEVGAFFGTIPQNYISFAVVPHTYLEAGDTVVVMGDLRGRTFADRPLDLPFVHIWTMRDGKATSFTEHFDSVKLNEALTPRDAPAPQIPAQASRTAQGSRV